MSKHVHIIGTGAMGCLWASYFPDSTQLHFIQRTSNPSGFHFKKEPDSTLLRGSSQDYQTLESNSIEHLIIATKAFDALNAFNQAKPFLKPNAQVVLLQNGMGSQQAIAQAGKAFAIYACSSTEGAYKKDAHTLVHAGKGENHIGPLSHSALQAQLAAWLPPQCFQWHENIEPILWKKLIINCAINPLTVLYDCKNGGLIENPDYQQHMAKICHELDQLVTALKLPLSASYETARHICQITANNYSSMHQDFKHNRQSELQYITGFMINACREHHIPCTHSESLYTQLNS